jgi:hypothetical protein
LNAVLLWSPTRAISCAFDEPVKSSKSAPGWLLKSARIAFHAMSPALERTRVCATSSIISTGSSGVLAAQLGKLRGEQRRGIRWRGKRCRDSHTDADAECANVRDGRACGTGLDRSQQRGECRVDRTERIRPPPPQKSA